MVRNQHKFLCLFLCVLLLVSALMVGSFSAFAAAGDTVYVRLNNSWSSVRCYMWNSDSDKNANWPGATMTKVSDNVYSYKLPKSYGNIIFNNGNSGPGNQTNDMVYPGANQIYDLSKDSWSAYNPGGNNPTTPTSATSANPSDTITVYLKNSAGWSSPNCYMWNSDSDKNSEWPGVSMKNEGNNEWSYTITKKYSNCIFNGDGGSSQTDDLTTMDGHIYDNVTKQWTVRDVSPIRVSSFSADPSSEIYTGVEVMLSANAASSAGTVTYKFSVTNSAGSTSVIATNKVGAASWIPTNAGNYTITCDFSDTAGNTNSRKLTLSVANDTNLANPVIKSVTPGNLNLVKRNAETTVSVNAGGGKTGTNLLFYKYIVKDPNGAQNTPYYTLNSTYRFTPTKLGKYTVDVYVQASDNNTVNRTYTYEVTDNGPTTPTVPTDPTPTSSSGYQKGDVDKNGKVNISDATYIQKHLARYSGYGNIDVALGDMNGDGIVTIKDSTLIQRRINGDY